MDDLIVTITPRTIVKATAIAAVVVTMAVALPATRSIAVDVAVAAALACLVRPGVLRLSRHMRAGVAIAVVYTAVLIGLFSFLAVEASALQAGTKQLRHAVPDRLEHLQRHLAPGNALRRFLVEDHVVARVRTYIDAIPSRFIFGTSSPFRSASQLGLFALIASLSAFMVTRGPAIFRRLASWLPARWQETATAAGRAAYHDGGAYIRRSLVLAAASGLAGGGVALACHVPGAAVMGLWVGLWALIPTIGIGVATLPIVALAFGQGTVEGVVSVVGSIGIAVAAEAGRRRWIEQPTVSVGPLPSLVAVMVGMELGRWLVAFLLLTAAAFITAGTDGLRIRVQPRVTRSRLPAASGDGRPGNASMPAPESGRRSVELDTRSLVLAGVAALAAVALVAFARSIPHSLVRLAVGLLIALALDRPVGLLQSRLRSRQLAVAAVIFVAVAAAAAFALYAVPRAAQQSRHVSAQARALVSELDRVPIIGARIHRAHLDARIRRTLNDLPHVLTTHDKTLRGAVRTAGDSLLAGSWMLLVALAALLDGPTVADRVKSLVPEHRRARVERVARLSYETLERSAGGAAFSSLLQGAVVMVIALAFQVPLAPVLAANAALWNFIPQVGGLMAGLPLVVFALTRGLTTGIVCGLLYLVYMVTNNHLLHPLIVGRAVHISPLTSLIAVLIGVSLGGFVGGLLATPLVGLLRALTSPGLDPSEEASSATSPLEPQHDRGPPTDIVVSETKGGGTEGS